MLHLRTEHLNHSNPCLPFLQLGARQSIPAISLHWSWMLSKRDGSPAKFWWTCGHSGLEWGCMVCSLSQQCFRNWNRGTDIRSFASRRKHHMLVLSIVSDAQAFNKNISEGGQLYQRNLYSVNGMKEVLLNSKQCYIRPHSLFLNSFLLIFPVTVFGSSWTNST